MKSLKMAGIILLVALIAGVYFYPKEYSLVQGIAPAGTTDSTMHIASVNITPSTLAATSTSLLNAGGYDRVITSTDVTCTSNAAVLGPTGAGYVNFGITIATTSVPNQGLQANTNFIASTTLSTTTPVSYISTSTEGVITGTSRIWQSNTYWTVQFTATSSAPCTVVSVYRNL